MSDTKTYEMLWDCQFCDAKKNLGKTHRFCPNCGAPQNPDARYFPSDDEKVAVEDHQYTGVDVVCGTCSTLNSSAAEFCLNCGNGLTEAAKAKLLDPEYRLAHGYFESSGSRDVTKEKYEAEMRRIGVMPSTDKRRRGSSVWMWVFLALAIVVCAGMFYMLTATTQQEVQVVNHLWERQVFVEEFQRLSDSSWDEQVPANAYNVSCSQRQRDTRQVADGQECRVVRQDNGDGTFSERNECQTRYRSEPIYDQYCNYMIDGWSSSNSVPSSGNGLAVAPFWGETSLNCDGIARLGCERIAGQRESYVIVLQDADGNSFRCGGLSQSQWETIQEDSRWVVDVGQFTGEPDCNSLRPAG